MPLLKWNKLPELMFVKDLHNKWSLRGAYIINICQQKQYFNMQYVTHEDPHPIHIVFSFIVVYTVLSFGTHSSLQLTPLFSPVLESLKRENVD